MMLKVLLHEPRPLRWWFEQHLLNLIDMAPTYQRRAEIWAKWKQGHLIDSLLNDFDVPKFYVANFAVTANRPIQEHAGRYAIIDGKQRFGAIFSFFKDEIPLNSSTVLDEDPAAKIGRLRYSELKVRFPHLAHKIENFQPTVMSVITDDKHKIEELFVRLNAGEHTTGAERRNAMGGPVPVIVRDLADHVFFTRNIAFNVRRMQDHNLIVKLLLFEFRGGLVNTKKADLDSFAKDAFTWDMGRPENAREDLGPYGVARDKVYEGLDLLANEFEQHDKLLTKQAEIPIYYWCARNEPRHVNELRDFVLQFSDELLSNLRLQREDPNKGDPELAQYYTLGRTSNDHASMLGRYKIFKKRFQDFRRPRGRRTA